MLPIVIVAVLGAVITAIILTFNKLIRNNNRTKNALSDVDVQLKRRYDLVPNLVEVVKGYQQHEASVLEEVTLARTAAIGVQRGTIAERAVAETALSGALKSFFMVAENYPDLKASENFKQLQMQLVTLEDDIQSARRYYNACVREMNTATQVFPSSIVALAFGFKEGEFFGADEKEKANVNVSFAR
ncbi:MAG: LemA family protein [Patescibacteria group bacterium]|jgi:LemA protein